MGITQEVLLATFFSQLAVGLWPSPGYLHRTCSIHLDLSGRSKFYFPPFQDAFVLPFALLVKDVMHKKFLMLPNSLCCNRKIKCDGFCSFVSYYFCVSQDGRRLQGLDQLAFL